MSEQSLLIGTSEGAQAGHQGSLAAYREGRGREEQGGHTVQSRRLWTQEEGGREPSPHGEKNIGV